MRHSTPTSHPQGVKVSHLSHKGRISFADPWMYIDKVATSAPADNYNPHFYYMSCSFSDKGVSFGHEEVSRYGMRTNFHRHTVSWSHVPAAVRHAIIADHPEWIGTVWTV
jgi:hypothetical protein